MAGGKSLKRNRGWDIDDICQGMFSGDGEGISSRNPFMIHYDLCNMLVAMFFCFEQATVFFYRFTTTW